MFGLIEFDHNKKKMQMRPIRKSSTKRCVDRKSLCSTTPSMRRKGVRRCP